MKISAEGVVAVAVHEPTQMREILLDPPGSGEVLVRLRASGVCHSDIHYTHGQLGRRIPVPPRARRSRCDRGSGCRYRSVAGGRLRRPFLPRSLRDMPLLSPRRDQRLCSAGSSSVGVLHVRRRSTDTRSGPGDVRNPHRRSCPAGDHDFTRMPARASRPPRLWRLHGHRRRVQHRQRDSGQHRRRVRMRRGGRQRDPRAPGWRERPGSSPSIWKSGSSSGHTALGRRIR